MEKPKKKTARKPSAKKTGADKSAREKVASKTSPAARPAKARPKEKADKRSQSTGAFSYHVGIGASAGGLDSLEKFFRNMPDNTGMIFTVITNLDPQQSSILPNLLQRHTSMEVIQIENGTIAERNQVYVTPVGKFVDTTAEAGPLKRNEIIYYSSRAFMM